MSCSQLKQQPQQRVTQRPCCSVSSGSTRTQSRLLVQAAPRAPSSSSSSHTPRRLQCRVIQQNPQQLPQRQEPGAHAGAAAGSTPTARRFSLLEPSEALLSIGDAEKELSRQYRRTTFDHERWALHRSTGRYWRHIKSMFRSRVVKGLAPPLIYVGSVSVVVCLYESLLHAGVLPDWAPGLAIRGASTIFSVFTFALSLLLVFRTNSAYQRWNDSRRLWGLTTNRCRDLARQCVQWCGPDAARDAELVAAQCRCIKAFPVALMASLRNDHDLAADLALVLRPEETALLLQQPHVGTAVLQQLSALVAASRASEGAKLRIDENITCLQDTMGGCERIFRTPLPLFYTRHTSRFLTVFLTMLPLATADQVGWMTVPVCLTTAFFLLGIEEIGVQVEEPHGILALEVFCDGIIAAVDQAEQAGHDMRAAAAARAAGQVPPISVPPTPAAAITPSSSSGSSSSDWPRGWSAQRGSSSSSRSAGGGRRLRVAGERVAAAEVAFNVSSSTFDEGSSAGAGTSIATSSTTSSEASTGGPATLGSEDAEDAVVYRHSSVSQAGAEAESEPYSF